MSKKVQKRAGERRDQAKRREQTAGARAVVNRQSDERMVARRHEATAKAHAAAAEAAEALRQLDVEIEGDQSS